MDSVYIAIDLKSFYASAECVQRKLNPLTTNLVVADTGRTEKTICLAVSPSLKSYGIPGRARLFEVIEKVKNINGNRLCFAKNHRFSGKAYDNEMLLKNPDLELDYIAAKPRMALYMKISRQIVQIYLRFIAPEDIHVYSVDEVFIYATPYLRTYKTDAYGLAMKMIKTVLAETGITAIAGIGPNLYLCKIAMDVEAKHMKADKDGVRIAFLDEKSYREKYWSYKPITDFWRIGPGIARRLEKHGMLTMGDIARMSVNNEDILYRLFGVNAELIIDHAWGVETCTMKEIKSYRSRSTSISTSQILKSPYAYEKAKIVVREMADNLILQLNGRNLKTDLIVLWIIYDRSCNTYPAKGSINLGMYTLSSSIIQNSTMALFKSITDPALYVRRISIAACNTIDAEDAEIQKNLFDFNSVESRDRERQKAVLEIMGKYGKNAILKASDLMEGATTVERNNQIGGHNA